METTEAGSGEQHKERSERKVIVSLGVMCGDEHAGAPLERCLRSVLEKKAGCPVDEVVIGFNGKSEYELHKTIKGLGYHFSGKRDGYELWEGSTVFPRPPLKLIIFTWPGRFDVARNQYWKYLTGEWLLTIDADDILSDAGTEEGLRAIRELERDYGLEPVKVGTGEKPIPMQQWLASLPNVINVIYIGYDYQIDENGYVVVRQKSKRLVRRSLGHIWYSPDESGIHEVLTPVGAVPENSISNLGILMRHFPSQDFAARAQRNADILAALTKSDIPVEARHAYDTANAQVHLGQADKAEQSLLIAIRQTTNDLDKYTYRLAYSSLKLMQGNPAVALETAFAAIGLAPNFQEAYFIACEALYRMGKWEGVIEWYERGLAKAPVLLSRDQPLMRFIQPRGQAADSYLNLGMTEKGLKLAQECIDRYPESPLSKWVYERAKHAAEVDKLGTSLLDSAELMLEDAPWFAKLILDSIPEHAVTRGLDKTLRARVMRERVKNTLGDSAGAAVLMPLEGEWKTISRIELRDALDAAEPLGFQLLKYDQLTPKSATVKNRFMKTPTISFYSPAAVELWVPQFIETQGLGGSESSLVYLMRELAKRGHPVEVFTPHPAGAGSMTLWSSKHRGEEFSILQKDFTLIHDAQFADVLVTCRAPYLAREMKDVWGEACKRIFCWHQDNGYGNPWLWNDGVQEMQHHLHVSEWAKQGLMVESKLDIGLGYSDLKHAHHHILGNGVPIECGEGWEKVERNPRRVIYASDPSRGLERLLEIWPLVREQVPDAELQVFSSFRVMASLKQDLPGLPVVQRIEKIRSRCNELAPLGVQLIGWQPQSAVLEAMKGSGVYAYPGGPMAEGFGVSLVQAQACGCDVIAPSAGALPEVLSGASLLLEGNADFTEALVKALLTPRSDGLRKNLSTTALERHAWPVVAERFLQIVTGGLA